LQHHHKTCCEKCELICFGDDLTTGILFPDEWTLAVHEILADEAFTATDGLIFQSFVVTFVHPTYVWIALI